MKLCIVPRSVYSVLTIVFLIGAFVPSFIALNSCRFMRLQLTNYDSFLEIGLFGYVETPDQKYCTLYSPSDNASFDALFNVGKVTAALATVFGGLSMIGSWCICCRGSPKSTVPFGGILLCCSLFQGLSFLVLRSNICEGIEGGYFEGSKDYTCVINQGGRKSIAACVMWFISALIVIATPPPVDKGKSEFITDSKKSSVSISSRDLRPAHSFSKEKQPSESDGMSEINMKGTESVSESGSDSGSDEIISEASSSYLRAGGSTIGEEGGDNYWEECTFNTGLTSTV